MIDIHAHLHFKDYDADRDAVISRAREAGVEKMILVGTDPESSRAAVELVEKYDFLYASVGIHPHEFVEDTGCRMQDAGWTSELKELAKHPRVVAIGECGLDYFSREKQSTINSQQKSVQRDGFLAQMDIAKELGLPMIIHTRPSAGTMDAYEDVFEILKANEASEADKLKAILHCYQGDTEITKKFLGLPNAYFSFAGSITYPVKKTLVGTKDDPAEALKMIPMERIFVETDCPYLAPQPVRGTRNEPAYVRYTLEGIAASKTVDTDTAEKRMESTVLSVFRDLVV
jgi:TatD DNase family protein